MSSKILRYAGYAEEAVFGTPVAAEIHTDITGATLDVPDDPNLYYVGGLGRSRRIVRPGFYSPGGNIVQGVDVDSIAYFLLWALGDYFYDAAKHHIYGATDTLLPSFTARIGKDELEHVFAGCMINTLELAVDDSFAQVTLDVIAQKDAKAALQDVDALELSEEALLAFHELTLTNGLETARVKSFTLSIENNGDAATGRGVGSRFPYRMKAGERVVTASINLDFDDDAQLQRFWGGATGPADCGATEFALELKMQECGESTKGITIKMPRCIVSANPHQPTGRDEIDESITVQAMLGTVGAVSTEVLFEVANNVDPFET